MSACPAYASLLAERASGPVAAADAARLEAHLEGCLACRAEAALLAEAFALARVPASRAEERGAAALPARAVSAATRPPRLPALRWALGIAAAAAAASAFVVPALLHHRRADVGPSLAAAEAAWEAPDPETLWELSAAVDPWADDENLDVPEDAP